MAKLDKADTVFSQYIRLRDGRCRRCKSSVVFNSRGLPVSHQTSHFMGRGKENTRFDELNADCLCEDCHAYFTDHPKEHKDWQILIKGQEAVDQIILLSNQYKKKNREQDYAYWKARLKEIL